VAVAVPPGAEPPGGPGQPLERGAGFEFVDAVKRISTLGLGHAYDERMSFGPVMAYVWGLLSAIEPAFRVDLADPDTDTDDDGATVFTAGSARTISMNLRNFGFMVSKDAVWSPRM